MNPMNDKTEPELLANSFMQLLQEHRGGNCLNELSNLLTEVVRGVRLTGKAGSIQLKVNVKPAGKGVGAVTITDDITEKVPVFEAEATFRFATEDGQLVRNDPRQKELRFTSVPGTNETQAMVVRSTTQAAAQ